MSEEPILFRRLGHYFAGATGTRDADPGGAASGPPGYKRLWFSATDNDQQKILEGWADLGWVLCAVEPGLGGSYFWLRRTSRD